MEGKIVYLSEVPVNDGSCLFRGEPEMMDVFQAAKLLGVDPRTVRREIDKGKLRCAHIGRCIRISRKALLEYVGEAN